MEIIIIAFMCISLRGNESVSSRKMLEFSFRRENFLTNLVFHLYHTVYYNLWYNNDQCDYKNVIDSIHVAECDFFFVLFLRREFIIPNLFFNLHRVYIMMLLYNNDSL